MEKVSFPPLIELLKENAESLNQLLRAICTSKQINTDNIPIWFREVIEPVFTAVHLHDPLLSRRVFDVLYRDMLGVFSSQAAHADPALTRSCRLLLQLNPELTGANPRLALNSMVTATQRISRHSQLAAHAWIAMMQQIMPLVGDSNNLRTAGRIAAWRCGMAHLRELIECPSTLDPRLIAIIFSGEKCEPEKLKRRWNSDPAPTTMAAGGFTGFGGPFMRPPKVAVEGKFVFASDGLTIGALFADRYGSVFQESTDLSDDSLPFTLLTLDLAPLPVAKILSGHSDLTSWVHHDSTLYLTTSSSHAVFVYGAVDG